MSGSIPNSSLEALARSMTALTDLQKGIAGKDIEQSTILAQKFNAVAASLNDLYSAGRGIDNSLLLEIPHEMLEFLSEDVSNPELYQHEARKQYEKKVEALSNRLQYLNDLKTEVDKEKAVLESSS